MAKFIKAVRPDVLCLQETKCPDDKFPRKRFKRLGYEHIALNGQKGYHGVVVLSRLPFETFDIQSFCGKTDCRHVSAMLGERAGLRDPVTLHNFYVPAGGDIPDPTVNPKFAHKLVVPRRDARLRRAALRRQRAASILVGDLNVAPLEHDVWSHKQMLRVVSHTPVECEKLDRRADEPAAGSTPCACSCPSRRSSTRGGATARPTGQTADKGRRLDHIWVAPALADRFADSRYRKDARGWTRPSDHVPVTATLEVDWSGACGATHAGGLACQIR